MNESTDGTRLFGGSGDGSGRWPLLFRFGLALAAIVGLALFTMIASVMIADTARHDAAAINEAGSLRMQAYRIASLQRGGVDPATLDAAAARFERILTGATLSAVLDRRDPLAARYRAVRDQWTDDLAPTLDDGDATRYLDRVAGFVDDVDAMVGALQRQAETRIQMLRLIQGTAIFMTLILVFATMYQLHSGVVIPLRALRQAAYRASHGDLSVRARETGDDEIGELATAFNTMTDHLSGSRRRLEQQVASKTSALEHSNAALKLLYDTARRLALDEARGPQLRPTLERLEEIIGTGPITLCLAQPGNEHAFDSATSHPDGGMPAFCRAPACHDCLHGEIRVPGTATRRGVAAVPLEHGNDHYGVLLVEHSPGDIPAGWRMRLAEAMADQIAAACALARDARRQRRLALMEERAVIARELHDSLAQSLSYLKIQVARLQARQRVHETDTETALVLAELREGLNTAYRHLRELLTTFRLKINEPGLEPAMAATAKEFQARAGDGLQVHLDMTGANRPLDANGEIHLLQITREALANVVHHAAATETWVSLRQQRDGSLRLRVDDNGVGMDDDGTAASTHHYGLAIMRERGASLGGTVEFSRRERGGTRVEVHIPCAEETGAARREAIA